MPSYAFIGAYEINEDNDVVTVGALTVELDQATYYLYHPADSYSLLDQFCTQISTLTAATVSYSISTSGKVTLSSASNFSMRWDDLSVFGFTATSYSGNKTYTATNYLKHCWFPEKNASDLTSTAYRQGMSRAKAVQQIAADSTVYTRLFATTVEQNITFNNMSNAKTWNLSDDNSSCEEFWESTIQEGRAIYMLADWPNTTYAWEYKPDLMSGSKDFNPARVIPGYDGRWNIRMKLIGQ
jgi:hypothetical protein